MSISVSVWGRCWGRLCPPFQWTSIISLRLYYLPSDRQEGFVITRAGELLCPNPKRSRNITFIDAVSRVFSSITIGHISINMKTWISINHNLSYVARLNCWRCKELSFDIMRQSEYFSFRWRLVWIGWWDGDKV